MRWSGWAEGAEGVIFYVTVRQFLEATNEPHLTTNLNPRWSQLEISLEENSLFSSPLIIQLGKLWPAELRGSPW